VNTGALMTQQKLKVQKKKNGHFSNVSVMKLEIALSVLLTLESKLQLNDWSKSLKKVEYT
jgi:hypothetical protein